MAHSLDAIFRPRSVAVVGASRTRLSIGQEILHNLVASGFRGKVFPVNPNTEALHSMKCFPRVSRIPDPVDLAIIAVPKERVLEVVRDCRRKGVRGLVVITAGFQEAGAAGRRLGLRLERAVRAAGMRMIGPNCMGVINTETAVQLNATFAATDPLGGGIGFLSQSGALGEVILSEARKVGLGVAMFASLGNQVDVEANQLLEYWENDRSVRVILMYLESFGDPARFTRIARRLSRRKPLIAVKAGRTAAGARAAFSHTGSMAGGEQATESLLEQCGVLRAGSIDEMFDFATALASQRLPAGDRVGILTNAGGPAILATDACSGLGLQVESLGASTRRTLRRVLPAEGSVRNPVDLLASAGPREYGIALGALLADSTVHAVIAIFVSPVLIDTLEVARQITARARTGRKTVLACIMGKLRGREAVEHLRQAGIPVYFFPESAARALAAMVRYGRIRRRRPGRLVRFRGDPEAAGRVIRRARRGGRIDLEPEEVEEILSAYRFRLAPSLFIRSEAEAIAAADRIGYPVVLKIATPGIVHKTDVGGVLADLRTEQEVVRAVRTLRGRFPGRRFRARVQKRIPPGREVILGMVRDPRFGALVTIGTGGIYTEAIRDAVFRIHPITDREARDMVGSLRPLRGGKAPPRRAATATANLTRALLRFSQLVGEVAGLAEIEINPLIRVEGGVAWYAVDARARLAPDS